MSVDPELRYLKKLLLECCALPLKVYFLIKVMVEEEKATRLLVEAFKDTRVCHLRLGIRDGQGRGPLEVHEEQQVCFDRQ